MTLRIHRLAVAEIDHEVDYYDSRHVGLGAELEDEIDAVFATILRFPYAAPQWRNRRDRRVAVLGRFPFTVPINSTSMRSSSLRSRTPAAVLATGPDERTSRERSGDSR